MNILTDHEIIHVQEKTLTGNRDRRDWLSSKITWNETKWSREVFEEQNNNLPYWFIPWKLEPFGKAGLKIIALNSSHSFKTHIRKKKT